MADQFWWLFAACVFNWIALGMLLLRHGALERRLHSFMTDPHVFNDAMAEMEMQIDLERRELARRSSVDDKAERLPPQ